MGGLNEKMKVMQQSGNVDYDFVMMMRMQDQRTLDMENTELDNGKNPEMSTMCNRTFKTDPCALKRFV